MPAQTQKPRTRRGFTKGRGERLRQKREAAGLSRQDVIDELEKQERGLSVSQYQGTIAWDWRETILQPGWRARGPRVTIKTLGRWEREETVPENIPVFNRVCAICKTTPEWVRFGEGASRDAEQDRRDQDHQGRA